MPMGWGGIHVHLLWRPYMMYPRMHLHLQLSLSAAAARSFSTPLKIAWFINIQTHSAEGDTHCLTRRSSTFPPQFTHTLPLTHFLSHIHALSRTHACSVGHSCSIHTFPLFKFTQTHGTHVCATIWEGERIRSQSLPFTILGHSWTHLLPYQHIILYSKLHNYSDFLFVFSPATFTGWCRWTSKEQLGSGNLC